MVFDWEKATQYVQERGWKNVKAGLSQDWRRTSGQIYENGVLNPNHGAYLRSLWATPVLKNMDTGEVVECWKHVR
jgi:hypothetical protein